MRPSPELRPHFYVAPVTQEQLRRVAPGCARPGCGLPSTHPMHLRPNGPDFGDAPLRRAAAG